MGVRVVSDKMNQGYKVQSSLIIRSVCKMALKVSFKDQSNGSNHLFQRTEESRVMRASRSSKGVYFKGIELVKGSEEKDNAYFISKKTSNFDDFDYTESDE